MAQTWCRLRLCLRKFHTGQPLLKKARKKPQLSSNPDTVHSKASGVAEYVEEPNKLPLFVQQFAVSDWAKSDASKGTDDLTEDDDKIPGSMKSLADLNKSLEELQHELESLKQLKKSMSLSEDQTKKSRKDMIWGTPDPNCPQSHIPCGGCGANLHCNDTGLPGYLPQEKYKALSYQELETTLCYRCYCLSNNNKVMNIDVDKAAYKNIVKRIRMEKCLVVMVIDVTDIHNSIIPDYVNQVGKIGSILIVANKIDLIPKDRKGYLMYIKDQVYDYCVKANLNPKGNNIKDVCLISAKTGYGVEELISKLIARWETKGNVYLVGTTNSGKSTLFNRFLDSDYCKHSCRDVVQRATVSRWPGTTLNLIKFPIVKMDPKMNFLRYERLKEEAEENSAQKDIRNSRLIAYGRSANAILIGKVGKTEFRSENAVIEEMQKFVPTGGSFTTYNVGEENEDNLSLSMSKEKRDLMEKRRVMYEGYPDSVWTHDTPGLINHNQVINFLTSEELRLLLHHQMIRPRVFVMKPGDTMFVTGLARVDYIEGHANTPFAVFTNHFLPVHIMKHREADMFYAENIGTETLGVPLGEDDRLQRLPSLCAKQFVFETGDEHFTASADIQLSSLGWLSIGGGRKRVCLQVYTPGGRGMHLREPALLPNLSAFMGSRNQGTKSYKIRRLKP